MHELYNLPLEEVITLVSTVAGILTVVCSVAWGLGFTFGCHMMDELIELVKTAVSRIFHK